MPAGNELIIIVWFCMCLDKRRPTFVFSVYYVTKTLRLFLRACLNFSGPHTWNAFYLYIFAHATALPCITYLLGFPVVMISNMGARRCAVIVVVIMKGNQHDWLRS